MRNAFLAGASAFALVLGGCSMFQSGDQPQSTGASQAPASSSSSSQAPAQAQSQTATTDQVGSDQPMATHAKHRSGMKSGDVKQAQQKLKDDGDYMGNVDGKFGSKTAEAVKQFQKKNGLQQTGRLDRDTRGKLSMGTTGSGSSTPPAAAPSSDTSTPPATAPSSGPSTPAPKSAPATTPNGSL